MSDIKPILPTADDLVRSGVDTLRALRPKSAPFLNNDLSGNYGKLVHGIRSQATLALSRLANGVANGRLPSASGDGLRNLVINEFDSPQSFDPTFAVGEIVLSRTQGTFPAGSIKKGTRFHRSRNLIALIPYADADYRTTVDWFVSAGQQTVTIPIQAASAGANSNQPSAIGFSPDAKDLSISDPIFDVNFTVAKIDAAGGTDTLEDPFLRQFATASALGQFAPNSSALLAGTLKSLGVRHVINRDDFATGISTVFIADQSWAANRSFAAQTQQYLLNPTLQTSSGSTNISFSNQSAQFVSQNSIVGYGCRISVLPANNQVIGVNATVTLRSVNFLSQTDDITLNIVAALRNYFDNSSNWDIFRLKAIRGVISRADLRILTCPSADVIDVVTDAVLPEPSLTAPPFSEFQATHWYLANNGGATITYQAPT